ncbi:uncharacterized protein LOC128960771 [Oppia nitens]|uniref:uncharacterized protein LOC128960771 n=1 Tax=Oppia nitens TaxID=1686743 RepID=UPI0023DCD702|nr:uncharacterized protein LOC128960771 [Oppia nitens]
MIDNKITTDDNDNNNNNNNDIKKLKVLDMDEVVGHQEQDRGFWIVIDGLVYDISKFIDKHPGGDEVLREVAGTDASQRFAEIGHSDDARTLMIGYRIGRLDKSRLGTGDTDAADNGVINNGPVVDGGQQQGDWWSIFVATVVAITTYLIMSYLFG